MRKGTVTLAGREKNLFSSLSHNKVHLCWRNQKTESMHMDVHFYSWCKHLWLWTELLQIKHIRGLGLPLDDAKHEDIGRLMWWKHQHVLCDGSINIFPHKQASKLKSGVYLQRVGQGCVSWAGRCYSSWDCCGGRQSSHLAGDVAWPEQRNQTKMLLVLRNQRQVHYR